MPGLPFLWDMRLGTFDLGEEGSGLSPAFTCTQEAPGPRAHTQTVPVCRSSLTMASGGRVMFMEREPEHFGKLGTH